MFVNSCEKLGILKNLFLGFQLESIVVERIDFAKQWELVGGVELRYDSSWKNLRTRYRWLE